jgi:uncharacterized membrane protein YhhN
MLAVCDHSAMTKISSGNHTRSLAAAALLSAALAIAAGMPLLAAPGLVFIFKPLTTLLIIGFAWQRGQDQPRVRRWVLVGLVWSLAGDIALMWPKEGFLPGLLSFLLAHLAYLWAFTRSQRLAVRPETFVFYAVVAGLILWQLWPGVPAPLRLPVAAYVVCLAAMAAQAAALWRVGVPRGALLAAGGALFVASDALLATNKFATPLPLAGLWILATYWAAQWCIAAHLSPRAPRQA